MKKLILLLILSLSIESIFAQNDAQFDTIVLAAEPLIHLKKDGGILKDVNMIANIRFASNNSFKNGEFINSQFKANELRMEIIGKVTDRLKVRFRDVYSRSAGDAATTDLLRKSIDIATLEYEVNPKFYLMGGKMIGDWGGYEFDGNPSNIIVFNEWINNGDLFLMGIKASYLISPNHKFSFQTVNSSSRSFDYSYGNTPDIQASKAPLGYSANWNGTFFSGKFSTKWSYSLFNLAKNKYMNFIAIGNQYKTSKMALKYDFKYSIEDIDRTSIISNYIGLEEGHKAQNVTYYEHWFRGEFNLAPRFTGVLMLMSNSSNWKANQNNNLTKTENLRNTWIATPAIEYNIHKAYNARIFFSYVGRYDKYSTYAKENFNLKNENSGQLLIGFISQLVIF
jgi:hypothetical protein